MVFADILGQEKATRLLTRSMASGRLAHAYLFTGPDGVGKASTARAMAATLFCRNTGESAPCGTCSGCLKFSSHNHPDFLHILPEGAVIKIDQIRELKKTLSFPPLESPLRITLIEDVHTMRREAANSLLKLLEEPPPHNLLLLTADESEPLLPTIMSRCQIIPFYSLPAETAAEILLRNNSDLTRDTALPLAVLSGGCPGRHRNLDTDQLLRLHREIIDLLLNEQDSDAAHTENALHLAVKAGELKEELETLLDLIHLFFKEVMVTLLCGSDGPVGHLYLEPFVIRARERWNLEQLSDNIQIVDFAKQALARNCNRQTVCEVLLLRLTAEAETEL